MREIPTALADHLKGESTTLCHCWRVDRIDGVSLGFADHDQALQFDGLDFEPMSGFEGGLVDTALGLNIDTQELLGVLDSTRLKAEDLRGGRYDNASVRLYLVNWAAPEDHLLMRSGVIGEIMQEDSRFRAEFRSLSNALDQTQGRRFSSLCDATLGDARCGVNLQDPRYVGSASVSKIIDPLLIEVTGLSSFANDWFSYGRLTWTIGGNQGIAVEISKHQVLEAATVLQLWQPMATAISVDDEFTIEAGCSKQFETCKSKFSNHLNFRGFPHVPGNDHALSFAPSTPNHDGGPLVP